MAGSLLILLDDIATVLDDVSVLTKVAAKKTAGVLGDDLALNAQQVTGVRADRELAVVWAVAKGSFINKCILVPVALGMSAMAAWLITPLLMIGGLFLCYEGSEKVIHKFAPKLLPHESDGEKIHEAHLKANANDEDLVALERDKVKGAIATDFILSAEIVVISLGTMTQTTFMSKALALSAIAVVMTVGVYGLVAVIVKMDDVGMHWVAQPDPIKQKMGNWLLGFAPLLMKFLSVAGTLAMFLVGGGILVHGVDMLHHQAEHLSHLSGVFAGLTQTIYHGMVGFIAGCVALMGVVLCKKIKT